MLLETKSLWHIMNIQSPSYFRVNVYWNILLCVSNVHHNQFILFSFNTAELLSHWLVLRFWFDQDHSFPTFCCWMSQTFRESETEQWHEKFSQRIWYVQREVFTVVKHRVSQWNTCSNIFQFSWLWIWKYEKRGYEKRYLRQAGIMQVKKSRFQDSNNNIFVLQRLSAFTRSQCTSDPTPGGSFSIMGDNITGIYTELVSLFILTWYVCCPKESFINSFF